MIDFTGRSAAAAQLFAHARSGKSHQPIAAALCRPPQLGIRHLLDPLPPRMVGRAVLPLDAEIAVEELVHLHRQPAAGVHAVGDGEDRNLGLRQIGPDGFPHPPRHCAVQLAHAIRHVRQAQREHGHAELLAFVVRVLPPQAEKLFAAQSQRVHVRSEILLDEVRSENLVPRRNRRVSREAGAGPNRLARGRIIDVLLFHQDANSFEAAERGMAFVEMTDRRRLAQRSQRPQAPDSQHDLLLDPRLLVAAVKLGRDLAIIGVVLGNVAIEQVKRDSADLDAPHFGLHCPAWKRDWDENGSAVRSRFLDQGERKKIVFGIALLLPAIDIQILAKISFPVHQPHAD